MTFTLNELTPSEVANLASRLRELTVCIHGTSRKSETLTIEQVQLWQSLNADDPSVFYTTLDRIESLRQAQKDLDVGAVSRRAMSRMLMHSRWS